MSLGSSIALCAATTQSVSARTAVPAPELQKRALATLQSTYKADFAAATTPAAKAALAKKLLDTPAAVVRDPEVRFVLLTRAKELAVEAGNAQTALAAAVEISRIYEVDPLLLKLGTLTELTRSARSDAEEMSLIALIEVVVDEAIMADRYAEAKKLAELALVVANKGRDFTMPKRARQRLDQVSEIQNAFNELEKTKSQRSSDAEANLALGRFRCFYKNDWAAGLPLIASSHDATLKRLAELEGAAPAMLADQVTLADLWWDLAPRETGLPRMCIQAHAAEWYALAVGDLAGLPKARAESRILLAKNNGPLPRAAMTRSEAAKKPTVEHASAAPATQSALPPRIAIGDGKRPEPSGVAPGSRESIFDENDPAKSGQRKPAGGTGAAAEIKGNPKTASPARDIAKVAYENDALTVAGDGFVVELIDNAGKAFNNRGYVWKNVPEKFRAARYTRTDGGRAAHILVTAKNAITIYTATAPVQKGIRLEGWQPTGEAFSYSDPESTQMIIFRRDLKAGEEITLPQGNWSGMILLIPGK